MPTPTRAITYARQSKAREDDSAASPEAQRRKTKALVEARGWTFVDHFEDVGASGYDPRAARPGLDAALDAIRRGEASVLVVYRLDRLTRRGVIEAVRLVGELAENGASLLSVNEPFLDTGSPMGRGIFALFAAMAEQESASISTRTKASKALLREAGSHAGGRPPFGMRAESVLDGRLVVRRLVPDLETAGEARKIIARVMEGESVRSVVRDLNAREVRTINGAEWGTSTLMRWLRSPQLAGYMPEARDGKESGPNVKRIALAEDGSLIRPWEGIVSPEAWHALQRVLDSRAPVRGRGTAPSLFGGFLMECACGSRMGIDRRLSAPGGGAYRCMKARRGQTGCDGVAVAVRHSEAYVTGEVLRRLSHLDPEDEADAALLSAASERFAAKTTASADIEARSAAQRARAEALAALDRLDDDRAAGLFDGANGAERYARQVRNLSARVEGAAATLESLAPSAPVVPFLDLLASADDPSGDPLLEGPWASWSVEEWREFLDLFLVRVVVNKGRHSGGNSAFRGAERLKFHWRA
ncbi:hypothetical protein ASE25_19365 [Terrabacter sp. Root85]|uniref:recombinase family protein n=1 Tax=Terrabacter sp. Root85 TaxID=1736603 RepID=UPI0006FD72F5|nr:recombinase family protein [Terrabacter sp. Root85]KRC85211.1 hypothetical protein ASE25_19365 [Terrabacter sp. Root85]